MNAGTVDRGLALGTLVPHRGPIGWSEIRSLIDAAAGAGFSNLEFRSAYFDWAVADGVRAEEFFAYPRARGLSMFISEVSDTWVSSNLRGVAEANAHLVDLSARAGAFSLLAVARELPSFGDATVGLAHLCDMAAERDLAVTLEFLPYAGLRDLETAAQLIEAVDRENLGLCLDTWHWYRQLGGPDIATLRSLPPDRIHVLQLADATAEPAADLFDETLGARLLPGEGAIDMFEVLDILDEIGASPVVVAEVFSSPLSALDPAENARRQYAATTTLLDRHRVARTDPATRRREA